MSAINPTQIDGNPIKELPLSALIQPANDIIAASGVRSFTQRATFAKDRSDFFIELGNQVPRGEIRPLFPQWEADELLTEGWEYISFNVELGSNTVSMSIEGHYFKTPVPVDLTLSFTQGASGYTNDSLVIIDRRNGREHNLSFKEIMETRMKSGDYKYAGTNDVYGEMSMVRIVKVFNRFLKDWSLKNRIIEKD
jgi:hypothetical protein